MNRQEQVVDVVILGAGGAGYPAAFLLARAGLRVVMVDPIGNLGGNCLAEGCIPSKAVREASLVRARAGRYALFGLDGPVPDVDWQGVLAHKDRVQQTRYRQHRETVNTSSVFFHAGAGRVLDERHVEVNTTHETFRYNFHHLVIATGSQPQRLSIPGAHLAITSSDLFRLGAELPFPRRLVILGGGYIGVEVASMLNNLGTEVTVLQRAERLLPNADPIISQALYAGLNQRVRIELGAEATGIEKDPYGLQVRYRQQGQEHTVMGDTVLMATGRECVLPDGIQALGLSPLQQPRGALPVNDRLQTEDPHIYAPGDVNGRSMLYHSAVRQSLIAAHNILAGGQPAGRMDFESVPFTVFTEPEAAWVGLTEQQARDRYGCIEIANYDYAVEPRAQIFDETHGFIRLIFASQTSRLLGAQIVGLDAAQVIAPLALAVSQGLGATALTEVVFPHPMVQEGINKAARQFRA
ncbi:MAG TPA: dihydrolipoyl dehydrogenase [Ktedonobacteraceae bacterium]